ncbi:DoxX family protein [Haloarcula amylovorans]|uniref:DoxX family protein n=1 Tax=Haloarcula amylovorans TaxID=2562280 RepID=UPI001075E8CE|nr:DoxX family protein [Halomicroarcula amylolytica]
MLKHAVFVLARAAFGAKFARDGYNNLADLDDMVVYADSVGVPFAGTLVPIASSLLFVGGIMLALGLAPLLGAVAIAAFMLGVTPGMHDFWNESGDERDAEFDNFLRNVAFLGGAVAFWASTRDGGHQSE